MPFLIGSVDLARAAIDLYCTNRLSSVLLERPTAVRLHLDQYKERVDDKGRHVNIGPPVLSWTADDVAKRDFNDNAAAVIKALLAIERHNPFVEEPFLVRQTKSVEGRAQWLDPGGVFMQYKDARHLCYPIDRTRIPAKSCALA